MERGSNVSIRSNLRTKRTGWVFFLLVLTLIAANLALWGSGKASAERLPLDIVIEHGFDGKMKDGKWFPVKMTVTNPGDDVSGDLTVRMTGDVNGGKGIVYAEHVDLPKQSTKIVWFALPGKQLNERNNVVAFYEKGADKGKVIPFSHDDVSIITKPLSPETLMAGVMARDPDTLNFLSLLNQKGYQVQTTLLSTDDFPWEATMLDGLDVIAFNDAETDRLKPEQVKDIEAWVERGGKLILAGGAGYAKTASPFGAIAPVTVSGTASVAELGSFVQATGRELDLKGPVTVSAAAVKSGETLYAEKGIPLVVEAPVGQGSVTYIAYDLSMEPLASWNGNPAIWERILSDVLVMDNSGKSVRMDGMWELNNALEVFPQLIPPAYGILALLFLVYAIVVGPALYIILKRADRREWAWFAIPIVAIVTSVSIYAIGASGRGSTLAQTLGMNILSGKGEATRTAASSVFVPSGGSYELEWAGKRSISPFMVNDGSSLQSGNADMIIRSEPEKTVAAFKNVPFWSVRKVFGSPETVADAGQFDYTIRLDASGAKGEIVNNTKSEMYEAGIFIGGQWIRIGDMKPGEKKPFQVGTTNISSMMYSDWGHIVFPYAGNQDVWERERSLLNSFSRSYASGMQSALSSEPMIVAFSKSASALFKIDGKDVQSERIDLYAQPLKLDYVQGDRIFIPRGVVVPFVESSNVAHMSTYNNGGIDVGKGDFKLVYRIPSRSNWKFEKITLAMQVQQQFTVELWNESSQSWEALNGNPSELDAARVKQVLTAANELRLQVTNSQNGGRFTYPTIGVEGVVLP